LHKDGRSKRTPEHSEVLHELCIAKTNADTDVFLRHLRHH